MPNADDKVPAIVRNEWFYLIARFCMIAVATVGVPVIGAMLSRAISTADKIDATVQEQTITIRLLATEMKIKLENYGKDITDHELRLRMLERGPLKKTSIE